MSVLQHRRPQRPPTPERPRAVEAARLGCAPGTSRHVLDTLMAAGTREAYRRSGELMGDLRAAIAQERATYTLTSYILDDTEAALAGLAFQLAKLIKSGANADPTVRMLLMPVEARFAELLPAKEDAPMPDRQWFEEPTAELVAAAAQRAATEASWRGEGLRDGTPPPIGMDPFHKPGDPACVCTQCTIAAAVAMKAGNARTETAR